MALTDVSSVCRFLCDAIVLSTTLQTAKTVIPFESVCELSHGDKKKENPKEHRGGDTFEK